MYQERPDRPEFPRMDDSLKLSRKLLPIEESAIKKHFASGMTRNALAARYGVSYHTIWYLTCTPAQRERYEQGCRERSRARRARMKTDPTIRRSAIEATNEYRRRRKKIDPGYKEYLRLMWLHKNPPKTL